MITRRNVLGLPYGDRHRDKIIGTETSTVQAVREFIESAEKAKLLQADMIKRLMRHGSSTISHSLERCTEEHVCGLSCCKRCGRAYRTWIGSQAIAYRQFGVPAKTAVILIAEIPAGKLRHVRLQSKRDAFRKRLFRAGVVACIGNLEVTFKPERKTWSLHAHCLVFGESGRALRKLDKSLTADRAVRADGINDPLRQITYLFKFATYYRHPSSRRLLPLPDEHLAELTRWRAKTSFADHLVLLGFRRQGTIQPNAAFERLFTEVKRDSATWRRGDLDTGRPFSARSDARTSVKAQTSKSPTRVAPNEPKQANRVDRQSVHSGSRRCFAEATSPRSHPHQSLEEAMPPGMHGTLPRILARGRGAEGDKYLRVEYRSAGRLRRKVIAVFRGALDASMASLDIISTPSRNAFARQIEVALQDLPVSFRVADKPGFQDDAYVWPDGSYVGEKAMPICLGDQRARYAHRGNHDAWQVVYRLARGNSRVMMVLAHALTGPVAQVLGCEVAGIQLVGEAGKYKTSVIGLGGAMWGIERKSWDRTLASLEGLARDHDATFLAMDDFRPHQGLTFRDLRTAAIRVFDGHGRGRWGEADWTFRTPIVSTSNRTLDELALDAGVASDDDDQAALRGRLMDVPLAENRSIMFERLHGYNKALPLMKRCAEIARENPGTPSVVFVENLLAWRARDEDGLCRWLIERRDAYANAAAQRFQSPPGYDLTRVHMKMGTIYATGCLAIRFGQFPWSRRELFDSLSAYVAVHLGTPSTEMFCKREPSEPALSHNILGLQEYVTTHWNNFIDLRRVRLDPDNEEEGPIDGYIYEGVDELEVLMPAKRLATLYGGRIGLRRLQRDLRQRRLLIAEVGKGTVRRAIYAGDDRNRRPCFVAIRATAFGLSKYTYQPGRQQPERR